MNYHIDISEQEWNEIEAFIAGKLQGEALASFEEKVASDKEWEEKIKVVRLTAMGIEREALSEELKQIDLNEDKLDPSVRNKQKRNYFIALLSAAAIILGLLFFSTKGFRIFKNENEKLFEAFYKPDDGLLTTMGETERYQFDEGMVAYKSKEYKKAIEQWRPLWENSPQNDTLNYFLGCSFLALDQSESAQQHYEQVLTDSKSEFYDEAQWYLGLTLLKLNKTSEAIEHIKASDHPQKDNLLRELKE